MQKDRANELSPSYLYTISESLFIIYEKFSEFAPLHPRDTTPALLSLNKVLAHRRYGQGLEHRCY